ncbi:unnamed protein product [Bursaphelenchus okinawaensis]|uniref:URB1 C-terminal domain-containing protein n=1 Tax=Bursaphelenchus okinawaensis TaxID=465554 RepID=A0A811KTA5_9BILA|nr:unnamed protein product [Bursaphelenchus okinawaensis]CAG9111915.1 unnamed protein product [Bursaphelenchus okinawaensis]
MAVSKKQENGVTQEIVDEGEEMTVEQLVERFDRYYHKVVSNKREYQQKFYQHLMDFLIKVKNTSYEAVEIIVPKIDVKFLSELLIKYKATQNDVDTTIFNILTFLEKNLHVGLRAVSPLVFSEKSRPYYANLIQFGRSLSSVLKPDQILNFINPEVLKKTAFSMVYTEYRGERAPDMYDPRFMLLLFLNMVQPGSDLSAKRFITSNCLHFCFSALSLQTDEYRALGYRVINDFTKHLNDLSAETFPQKALFIYLLKLFKNSVTQINERVMSPLTRFFCEVFDVTLDPLDPMFKGVWASLTMKPAIELNKLPEFKKFFFSTASVAFSKERSWVLDIAVSSLECPQDYMAVRNTYVAETLMAAFTSCMIHKGNKLSILKFFKACLRYPVVTKDITLRCNLPTWISYVIKHRTTTRFEQIFLTQIFVHNIRIALEYKSVYEDVLLRRTFKSAAEKVSESINSVDDHGKAKFSEALSKFLETGEMVFNEKVEDDDKPELETYAKAEKKKSRRTERCGNT